MDERFEKLLSLKFFFKILSILLVFSILWILFGIKETALLIILISFGIECDNEFVKFGVVLLLYYHYFLGS